LKKNKKKGMVGWGEKKGFALLQQVLGPAVAVKCPNT
jgi:hypothetical protein